MTSSNDEAPRRSSEPAEDEAAADRLGPARGVALGLALAVVFWLIVLAFWLHRA